MTRLLFQCVFISVMLTIGSQGEEYITAFYDAGEGTVLAATGQAGGWYQVQSDSKLNLTAYEVSRTKVPSNATGKTGIENNTVLVKGNNVDIYFYKSFSQYSPLPITALGTKYLVSSCLPPGKSNYSSVLVIATHSYKTDVNITFRLEGNINFDNRTYTDGDTLTMSLQEYQTLTINSDWDLSGTVVMATQTVAVFSGTLKLKYSQLVTFTQLLPVHLYGQEYVVAVDDNPSLYQIQFISEASNTRLTSNDGSAVITDESGIYKQNITGNTNVHLSTSKPVMITLCALNTNEAPAVRREDLVVVPPVSLYTKETSVYPLVGNWKLKITTDKAASDTEVKLNSTERLSLEWQEIPGSRYKVGTVVYSKFLTTSLVSITSSTSFTVLLLGYFYMHIGAYNFSQPTKETDLETSHSETFSG